jgi:dTDP-4-dehydrorhamnose 3,5-epimerase
VKPVELKRHHDDGGAMTELLRPGQDPPAGLEGFQVAQINYSTLQPEAIKAFHVHMEQTDVWFVPPEDRVLLVLLDVREGSSTEGVCERRILGDGTSSLIRIPPGVAHGCRNIGQSPARIIYCTDRLFSPDPEDCDEGRLPWDMVGAGVWELGRE